MPPKAPLINTYSPDDLGAILALDRARPTAWLHGNRVRVTYVGTGQAPVYQIWRHDYEGRAVGVPEVVSGREGEWGPTAKRVLYKADLIAGRVGV